MSRRTKQFSGELDPVERRLQIQQMSEQRDEYENLEPITLAEMPRSTSHSGWMRTEDEANAMCLTKNQTPAKKRLFYACNGRQIEGMVAARLNSSLPPQDRPQKSK